MVLPIIGYGHPVLRKVAQNISPDYPSLKEIINNMYDTMYNANGVGLAAEQIGLPIRLFVVDTSPFSEGKKLSEQEQEKLKTFKKTFINAKILKEEGQEWAFSEGCLSIPDIHEDVVRKEKITIEYCEEDFVVKIEEFDGLIARVIQHEYDHNEGVLFTDKIPSLRKQLLKKKLKNIHDGKTSQEYRMSFINQKSK